MKKKGVRVDVDKAEVVKAELLRKEKGILKHIKKKQKPLIVVKIG